MEEFTGLITNLGFPIACVIVLFRTLDRERETHKVEMDKMTDAVNNNTMALTKLCERMAGNQNESH